MPVRYKFLLNLLLFSLATIGFNWWLILINRDHFLMPDLLAPAHVFGLALFGVILGLLGDFESSTIKVAAEAWKRFIRLLQPVFDSYIGTFVGITAVSAVIALFAYSNTEHISFPTFNDHQAWQAALVYKSGNEQDITKALRTDGTYAFSRPLWEMDDVHLEVRDEFGFFKPASANFPTALGGFLYYLSGTLYDPSVRLNDLADLEQPITVRYYRYGDANATIWQLYKDAPDADGLIAGGVIPKALLRRVAGAIRKAAQVSVTVGSLPSGISVKPFLPNELQATSVSLDSEADNIYFGSNGYQISSRSVNHGIEGPSLEIHQQEPMFLTPDKLDGIKPMIKDLIRDASETMHSNMTSCFAQFLSTQDYKRLWDFVYTTIKPDAPNVVPTAPPALGYASVLDLFLSAGNLEYRRNWLRAYHIDIPFLEETLIALDMEQQKRARLLESLLFDAIDSENQQMMDSTVTAIKAVCMRSPDDSSFRETVVKGLREGRPDASTALLEGDVRESIDCLQMIRDRAKEYHDLTEAELNYIDKQLTALNVYNQTTTLPKFADSSH
jgi:hypothetical protein